jgi:hypothetical protein
MKDDGGNRLKTGPAHFPGFGMGAALCQGWREGFVVVNKGLQDVH